MAFDTIASIPAAVAATKEFARKKRVNRSAKLKQCKLDARREQWLSQVKNKAGKEGLNNDGKIGLPSMNERERLIGKLEINPGSEENEGLMSHKYSDSESSPSNSPSSSVLGSNGSGTNFTGSSASSSGGSFSGSVTEEDEAEDDCFDDWEAMADALAADDPKNEPDNTNLESSEHINEPQMDSVPAPKLEEAVQMASGNCQAQRNCRAWRSDDAGRPPTLPDLQKQRSFPTDSDRHCGRKWVGTNMVAAPSICLVCYEDLDLTDSSFLPCACGFRLCLFCHKTIIEGDGRCPGCRKHYVQPISGDASSDGMFKFARSFSMNDRF